MLTLLVIVALGICVFGAIVLVGAVFLLGRNGDKGQLPPGETLALPPHEGGPWSPQGVLALSPSDDFVIEHGFRLWEARADRFRMWFELGAAPRRFALQNLQQPDQFFLGQSTTLTAFDPAHGESALQHGAKMFQFSWRLPLFRKALDGQGQSPAGQPQTGMLFAYQHGEEHLVVWCAQGAKVEAWMGSYRPVDEVDYLPPLIAQ